MEKYIYHYPKNKIKLHTAIVFPNSYYVGMSNLGFQTVYHYLQSNTAINCERAFVDSTNKNMRTVENNRSIAEFDVILFSISFEGDLPNMINAIKNSGIELKQDSRKQIIIVGGIATTFLGNYLKDFADIIVSGNAETTLPQIIDAILAHPHKTQMLAELENLPGVYPYYIVDAMNNNLLAYHSPAINENSIPPHTVILSDKTEFAERALIAVSRSCKYNCAFCVVRSAYGQYDYFSPEQILDVAMKYIGKTKRIGLVAATLTNHPDFKTIIRKLNRNGFQVSFSSFRIEGVDDELLKLIIDNENKTLVIAPETASPRLQKLIKKIIPRSTIIDTVRRAVNIGIKRLKLYFIIGLPGEETVDLDEIIDLVAKITAVSKERAKDFGFTPEIIVDINPLVPKPISDFANVEMEATKTTKKKILYLKKHLHRLGRVFVIGESPRRAHLQYKIAHSLIPIDEL